LRLFWYSFLALALFLAATTPLAAGDAKLRIETGDTICVEVEAPAFLTRAFLVTNPSDETREILEHVLLPQGWQVIIEDSLFSLMPEQRDLRLIGIAIPADASPGRYGLTYVAKDRTSASNSRYETDVVVLPVVKLDIMPIDVPQRVLAGHEYSALFQIANRSNTPCIVTLDIESSAGFPAHLSHSQLHTQPNESYLITAIVITDRNTRRRITDRLVLTASVSDSVNHPKSIRASTAVEIVPRAPPAEDLYHRVPSRIISRFVANDEEGAFQVEYSGRGTLDPTGNYAIDYRFQGPRDLEKNLFGERDEYFVGVRHESGELRLGDQLFSLSPLLERHRLGRGALGSVRRGHFSAGGYSFKSRSKYPDMEQTAAFVGYSVGDLFNVQLNYLDKTTDSSRRGMFGLSSAITPIRNLSTEIEYAAGEREDSYSKPASAVRVRVDGRVQKARVSLEKIYADRDFPGYYCDQDHNLAAIHVPVLKDLQYYASYQSLAQNLEKDTTQLTAIRERNIQSGFTYTFPFPTTATLYLEELARSDELPSSGFDYTGRAAGVRLRHNMKALTLNASAKRGIWTDHLQDTDEDWERYGFGATFTPDAWQSYSGSFQTGHAGFSMNSKRSQTGAFTARVRPFRRLSLLVSFQKSNWSTEPALKNDQLRIETRYSIYRNHVVSFRYRKLDYEEDNFVDGTSYMIGYEIPVGMPVGKQKHAGCVKGRVYDLEDPEHDGISGVVLTLGDLTALTDGKGNFMFPSVSPGIHYLQVDNASIGLHRVTVPKAPIQVSVRGGRSEKMDLGVVRGAAIRGEAAMFGLAEAASNRGILIEQGRTSEEEDEADRELTRLRSQPNLHLELRSDTEVIHLATDHRGRFSFDRLRPGRWVLEVSPEGLPPFHNLERNVFDILLKPGAREEITVRIVPRERGITIVDEGKVPVVSRSLK